MRFLTVIFFLLPFITNAQDTIFRRIGEPLPVVIEKVTESRIIYKKFNTADSSKYAISRVDVASVRYQDGSKEIFSETSPDVPFQAEATKPVYTPADKPISSGNGRVLLPSQFDIRNTEIEIRKADYYIYGNRYSYPRMIKLLSTDPNPDVMKGVRDYKKASKLANGLGWGSAFAAGTAFYLFALSQEFNNYNSYNQYPNHKNPTYVYMNLAAVVSGVIATGMFASSIVIKKTDRRRAIKNAVLAHNKSLGF